MKPREIKSLCSIVAVFIFAAMLSLAVSDESRAESPAAPAEYRAHFLEMCDLSIAEMEKPLAPFFERYRKTEDPKTHHYPFFMDSYAIRPLCVAYDMTGQRKYLDACVRWADMMLSFQQRMTPKGAYHMNYGKYRQPDQDRGQWFVADCGSIAAAVLAVSARTDDQSRRKRYLDSIKMFSRMVIDNYASDGGGVTDGLWSYKAYLMYLLAGCSERYSGLTSEADRELQYVDELLFRDGKPRETDLEVWGMMTFGMMSYAEKISPGGHKRARLAR
ncbi:MAG: hypothetical protein GX594_08035 [Pirellulaceae bacterium]|nr:hypothetical protein [Pirellulaceae bacterium]